MRVKIWLELRRYTFSLAFAFSFSAALYSVNSLSNWSIDATRVIPCLGPGTSSTGIVLKVGITSPACNMPAMTLGSPYDRKWALEAFHAHHWRGFLMNGTALAYELFSDSTMIFSVYSELNCSRAEIGRAS